MGNPNLVAVINGKYAFVISGDEYYQSGWTPINLAIDKFLKYIINLKARADFPEEINQEINSIHFFDLIDVA